MNKVYTEQILSALKAIPEIIEKQETEIENKFNNSELRNSGKIYIAGDGAAFAAAYALKTAFVSFTEWTGNWVMPMTEREFAFDLSKDDLSFGKKFVVLLRSDDSNSEIMNTAELKCSENGCSYIAISSVGDGAFAYINLYARGLVLAAAIGKAQGKLTDEQVSSIYEELNTYVSKLICAVSELEPKAAIVAEKMKNQVRNYETIGTGMDYAAAWLLRYILYRTTGRVTTVEESEDYLHVNSLNVNPSEFGTFVYNSVDNPAYGRTITTIGNVEITDRFGVVITDGEESEIKCPIEIIKMPTTSTYPLKGLGMFIGGALIADNLA